MGVGISRPWNNMTSCGAFRRTNSEMQDPSNYQRIMVVNDNASSVDADARSTTEGQKNGSSLPKKDVVNEEKSAYPKNINTFRQEEDEEEGRISDYDGPMFMKSPSFSYFVRPIDLVDDSVKKGKKGEEMRENKTEAQGSNYVCNGEVCVREEKKNEMPAEDKEAGPGKEKRIYKIFSQYYKPSTVSGGVKSLFHHQPKHPKQPN